MWALFTIIMLIAYGTVDVIDTIHVKKGGKYAIFDIRISSIFVGFILALILFHFQIGESGFNLFKVLLDNPLVVLPFFVSFTGLIFWGLSLKHIGLSIAESVANSNCLFGFTGFIVLYLLTGQFTEIGKILTPIKLIIGFLVLLGICLLPVIEDIGKKKTDSPQTLEERKYKRKHLIIGVLFVSISAISDGIESVLSSLFVDTGAIGPIDYSLLVYFLTFFLGLAFFIFVSIKRKKVYNPFEKGKRILLLEGLLMVVSVVSYFLAIGDNAIKANILIILYPLFPLFLAWAFLKEKYTWKTGMLIGLILVFSTLFVVF